MRLLLHIYMRRWHKYVYTYVCQRMLTFEYHCQKHYSPSVFKKNVTLIIVDLLLQTVASHVENERLNSLKKANPKCNFVLAIIENI